jgi:hypothetical protein
MHCKLVLSLTMATLFVNAATVSAQYPAGPVPNVAVQTQAPTAVPPLAIRNGVAVPAPPVVLDAVGPGGSPMVLYPTPAPPTNGGALSAMTPQPTVAWQHTTVPPAPMPVTQTHVYAQQPQTYTPTYYWYYYQPPYQTQWYAPVPVSASQWAPGPAAAGGGGSSAGYFGPMSNARGEMGHVRYPYYSYRRPWYYPGQPSFNVTIDGPVW